MASPILLPDWQEDMVQAVVALVEGDEDVLALALLGSLVVPERIDAWSDVDLLLVVRERALKRFFPTVAWLAPLGAIFGCEQFSHESSRTTRLCFQDFRRLDIVLTTPRALAEAEQRSPTPFPGEKRILLSRAPEVVATLSPPFPDPVPSPPSGEAFEEMVDAFWFKAVVAVSKVARGDLLIALHLTWELLQTCAVLGMMLRDRATGSTQHRGGGMGDEVVKQLPPLPAPYTALPILAAIEESGVIFDRLAREWTEEYEARAARLSKFVARARRAL